MTTSSDKFFKPLDAEALTEMVEIIRRELPPLSELVVAVTLPLMPDLPFVRPATWPPLGTIEIRIDADLAEGSYIKHFADCSWELVT